MQAKEMRERGSSGENSLNSKGGEECASGEKLGLDTPGGETTTRLGVGHVELDPLREEDVCGN